MHWIAGRVFADGGSAVGWAIGGAWDNRAEAGIFNLPRHGLRHVGDGGIGGSGRKSARAVCTGRGWLECFFSVCGVKCAATGKQILKGMVFWFPSQSL